LGFNIRHNGSSDDARAGVKTVLICESYGEGDKDHKWEGGGAVATPRTMPRNSHHQSLDQHAHASLVTITSARGSAIPNA